MRKARLGESGFVKVGQLKERSEGVQAQWQTALGVVMAAGLDQVTKLAADVIARGVPRIE